MGCGSTKIKPTVERKTKESKIQSSKINGVYSEKKLNFSKINEIEKKL